jgi:hypothetical protein
VPGASRRCSICLHAKGDDIDVALVQRVPYREIERRYGVSKPALSRHLNEHVAPKVRRLRQGPATSSVFDVVRIERTRGTSYSEIAERIVELVNGPHLLIVVPISKVWYGVEVRDELEIKPALAVDATGTGRPVIDELKRRGLDPEAVQLTAGTTATRSNGYYNVPKRDLITQLIVAFQNGWVQIAQGVDHADQLKHELLNYRWKVKLNTGNETLEAWRERDHDDIVLGLAMAVQAGVRPRSGWRGKPLVGVFDWQGRRIG